jgi:tRNA pseudouridine38-40 synthase
LRTIRIDLAYDGTDFVGWQRQRNGRSVQEVVEEALAAACGSAVPIEGASRTDAGVHALRQVASARVETRLDDATLVRAMNARLPPSVAVLAVATQPDGFQAIAWARGKRYAYRIEHGERRSPIGRAYATWVPQAPDLLAMRAGAACLRGRHDFAAFASAGSPRASTVREVRSIHILRRRNVTTIAVEGNGFLYNQVRAFAGTLLKVGRGCLAAEDVAGILASGDRRRAGPTAPPEGLFLVRVLGD